MLSWEARCEAQATQIKGLGRGAAKRQGATRPQMAWTVPPAPLGRRARSRDYSSAPVHRRGAQSRPPYARQRAE